jgi:signal transduction histidine kinase
MPRKSSPAETPDPGPTLHDALAMLAHDLRNPLMMIRGEVALLRHAEGTRRPIVRACTAIDRHVSQIAALVSDLARVADPGALDMSGPRRRFDLQQLIAESVDAVSKLGELRTVHMSLSTRGPPPIIEGNRVRLTQAFTSVLMTATKCAKPGGTIRVSVAADEGHAEVGVWDTGRGIPKGSLPKLFDRLVAEEEALPNELGVGMVVARQIIGAHDGVLTGRTEGIGFGCQFIVRLPLADASSSDG